LVLKFWWIVALAAVYNFYLWHCYIFECRLMSLQSMKIWIYMIVVTVLNISNFCLSCSIRFHMHLGHSKLALYRCVFIALCHLYFHVEVAFCRKIRWWSLIIIRLRSSLYLYDWGSLRKYGLCFPSVSSLWLSTLHHDPSGSNRWGEMWD
jgi:hypothetical protein